MGNLPKVVFLLAAFAYGCGGLTESELREARHQAHHTATANILIIEMGRKGNISRRYLQEHVRDARKDLNEIQKRLKHDASDEAQQLRESVQQLAQILEDLERNPGQAGLDRSEQQLTRLEQTLRDREGH
jgi:hypothetical protein